MALRQLGLGGEKEVPSKIQLSSAYFSGQNFWVLKSLTYEAARQCIPQKSPAFPVSNDPKTNGMTYSPLFPKSQNF